jgi:hypothetical protein
MAGTSNALSEHNLWAAAVVGAALAFIVHAVKAASRPAVTAATAGFGNPVVSFVEDGLAAIVSILAVLAPVIAVILIVLLAIGAFFLIRAGWRRLRARRATPAVSASYSASTSSTYPGSPLPF